MHQPWIAEVHRSRRCRELERGGATGKGTTQRRKAEKEAGEKGWQACLRAEFIVFCCFFAPCLLRRNSVAGAGLEASGSIPVPYPFHTRSIHIPYPLHTCQCTGRRKIAGKQCGGSAAILLSRRKGLRRNEVIIIRQLLATNTGKYIVPDLRCLIIRFTRLPV